MATRSKTTDSKSLDDLVQRLESSMADFRQEINLHLQKSWQRMEQYFQQADHRFTELQEAIASCPQLEFTPTNPRYWIHKCEQYFDVNDVDEHHKVKLAHLHLNEEGDTWLSNELLHHNDLTWTQFVDRLCARFGVQDSETVIDEFNHLKQTGSVADYIKRFKDLQGQVLRAHATLSDKYFMSCFLGGLNDPLQRLVRAHAPLTIQEAMAKAKLHEAALKSLARHQQSRSSPSAPFRSDGLKPPWDQQQVKKDPTCYRCGAPWRRKSDEALVISRPPESLRIENMWRPNTRAMGNGRQGGLEEAFNDKDDDLMKCSLSQSRTTVGKVTTSAIGEKNERIV
ncbi:hypothetical protein EJ110_NYTH16713 [Nymphaea thermarum]|nr:hypothetical protein EJ110_NYTH16713 [Nymphaea thermarum]